MPPQTNNVSSFSIAANQQPFRLLELPRELLELLTSSDPTKLQFKSLDASDASGNPEAVLCTSDKTYFIRQQMTSNGVHVVMPSAPSSNQDGTSRGRITSIAQCDSSLELVAAPAKSAKSALRRLLPLYIESEDADRPRPGYRDKAYLFANIPMSHTECQQVWSEMVAFELAPSQLLPRRCFRPSPNVLLKTWTRLLEISRAEGINLAGTLRTGTMLDALYNADEEWPHELRAAIMNRLSSGREAMSDQEHAESALRYGSTLDRTLTVRWVGLLILQSHSETQPDSPRLVQGEFLTAWKEALPEEWREDAIVDTLPKESYALVMDYIRYIAHDTEHPLEGSTTVGAPAPAQPGKAAPSNKRKWHEKFAAARKQGKPSS